MSAAKLTLEPADMRMVPIALLASCLAGCASPQLATPREYLDEQTAATITVVKDPWIFTREIGDSSAMNQRDFLHLYAIDVNRMGDHRQYFAVLQSLPPASDTNAAPDGPMLELKSGAKTIQLQASDDTSRELGIAQPVADSYTLTAAWWYFPVDKEVLARVANTRDLAAAMVNQNTRIDYVLWRDGREELSELTAVLP